jgi:putative intracellular protease/amidase
MKRRKRNKMENQANIRAKQPHVLEVVANPAVATTTGRPVGFWAAELTHTYHEFIEAGYLMTVASPNGGKVEIDAMSDPRHPSKFSADDTISLEFLVTPEKMALLEDTPRLADLDVSTFDALVICGGGSPMFTFRDNQDLHQAIRRFYEAGKPVAALCHGVAALVDATLSDGSYLVSGKTVTGFANIEEDVNDKMVGIRLMPWRLEDALKERGANYIHGDLFKSFATRDGLLITGQQQYSGRELALLMKGALNS